QIVLRQAQRVVHLVADVLGQALGDPRANLVAKGQLLCGEVQVHRLSPVDQRSSSTIVRRAAVPAVTSAGACQRFSSTSVSFSRFIWKRVRKELPSSTAPIDTGITTACTLATSTSPTRTELSVTRCTGTTPLAVVIMPRWLLR